MNASAVALAMLAAAGCGGGAAPRTTVRVDVFLDTGAAAPARPSTITISWLDVYGFLFQDRLFPVAAGTGNYLGNVLDGPLRTLWPSSPERLEAAAAARTANDRLAEAGGALAAFPFCPALMRERSGDAATPDGWHRMLADIAHEIRTTEGLTPDPSARS